MAEDKLFDAARRGQVKDVEEVIQEYPNLLQFQDRWGLTALHSAAVAGCENVIAVLLDYRASVDSCSRSGQTALHFAAKEGRQEAVRELIRRQADVARRTAHGLLPIEVAQGGCAELIREEACRRIKVVEDDIEALQDRLSRAVAAKELLEAQLLEPPAPSSSTEVVEADGILAPQNALQKATVALAEAAQLVDRRQEGYWRRAAAWLSVQRFRGRAALMGTFMKQTSGDVDGSPFPWTGPLVSEHPLPLFDPEDEEMPASFARLALVSEEKKRRRDNDRPAEDRSADQGLEEEILGLALEMAVDEQTGRSSEEWEEVVSQLHADALWDWSKVEVRKTTRRRTSAYVDLGVFAKAPPEEVKVEEAPAEPGEAEPAEPAEPPPPAVVFEPGDIVGPLGGVLRRRKRYMEQHYGDELWFFHDPLAHELPLRIQSSELRTEALVLDMTGDSSNRLRYLRDFREDPLSLSELLPEDMEMEEEISQTSDVALWPSRSAMQRINSRSLPPPPPAPPASPLSPLSPSSQRADSPKTLTSTMSSFAEIKLEPPEANCQIVDVHVHGWPYSFVVASATICNDEELLIDRGEEFWERQRAVLERLRTLAPGLEEILTGVTLPEPVPPDPAGAFPPRRPHTRPSSKPALNLP